MVLQATGVNVVIPLGRDLLHPVRDVSIELAAGETVCIVGESGSGKSLTAFALTSLLPRAALRSASSIAICGQETTTLDPVAMRRLRAGKVGFVFQDPMTSLNPVLSVGEQLVEAFIWQGLGRRADARRRALSLLGRVGIAHPQSRFEQFPHQLSGGLRQRVMIAMALMCSPKLLIADEPTTALDVTTQVQILRLLKDLQREFDMGLVLITHDLGVVSAVADRVYVMYAGQVVESGPTASLFDGPAHPYLRSLLSCSPIPRSTRRGTRLPSIKGIAPLVTKDLPGCAFRDRCDRALSMCAAEIPCPQDIGEGHRVRCHFPTVAHSSPFSTASRDVSPWFGTPIGAES